MKLQSRTDLGSDPIFMGINEPLKGNSVYIYRFFLSVSVVWEYWVSSSVLSGLKKVQ